LQYLRVKARYQNKSNLEKGQTKILGLASINWDQISEIWTKNAKLTTLLRTCQKLGSSLLINFDGK